MLWTIEHVLNTESRLMQLTGDAYNAALQSLWWNRIMTERPGEGAKQVFEWLISQADIYPLNSTGDGLQYDDLVTQDHSVLHKDFGTALKISRNQFMDDAFGFAGQWFTQIGSRMALDPQYHCIDLIVNGETNKAYDGLAFYAKNHPVDPQAGTGGPAGAFDNLIDDLNDIDPTFSNATPPDLFHSDAAKYLVAAIAYIKSIKMPSHKTRKPRTRHLRPNILRVPPQAEKVAIELTSADFIGATQNVIKQYQLEVLVVDELASTPKHWWLDCLAGETPGLLPFVRFERDPYALNSYTGMTQAQLNRENKLEWILRGRYGHMYGHPYQSFLFKGAGP